MPSLVIGRKVKGGKLFRLKIARSDESLSVQLSGDFFLEPEEGIDVVEACLAGCLALSNKSEAEQRLAEAIANAKLRISGFGAGDVIDALWEARQ